MDKNNKSKENAFNREDRDLLVELKIEVQNIRIDIKELKDGTSKRIETLEKEKADRKIVDELQEKVNKDHEIRIRSGENWRIWVAGYAAALGAVAGLIISILTKHF